MPRIIKSRDELRQRINDRAQLIEVLPAMESARAINILLAKLREKTVASLDKKKRHNRSLL